MFTEHQPYMGKVKAPRGNERGGTKKNEENEEDAERDLRKTENIKH